MAVMMFIRNDGDAVMANSVLVKSGASMFIRIRVQELKCGILMYLVHIRSIFSSRYLSLRVKVYHSGTVAGIYALRRLQAKSRPQRLTVAPPSPITLNVHSA